MNFVTIKAKDLSVGDKVLMNGKAQSVTKIEPMIYSTDMFITLELAGTGVWGKNDNVTKVMEL